MSDFVFNVAKGRVNEYVNRVVNNDPANSALIVVLLEAAEAQSVLEDYDDLGTLLGAAGNTEATATDYVRKTITDTDTDIGLTVDDTNNRQEADFSDQVWTGLGNGNNTAVVSLIVCYDSDTGAGTDANIIPLTHHDFAVTPDNSDVTAQLNALGFFRAA